VHVPLIGLNVVFAKVLASFRIEFVKQRSKLRRWQQMRHQSFLALPEGVKKMLEKQRTAYWMVFAKCVS
jgi:hypothetical protein